MCGISGIFGPGWDRTQLQAMACVQRHRGPDWLGMYVTPDGVAGLAHNRLSIIDLSRAGRQPMCNRDQTVWISFNGEIYNYRELRNELPDYPYTSRTDTEVVIAAYERWGDDCLDHFIGMYAFIIWDARKRRLFAARDRFGIKPLYYHFSPSGALYVSSEIRTLLAAGIPNDCDEVAWATYLSLGLQSYSDRTFYETIRSLEPGHRLNWRDGALRVERWYDLAERVGPEFDTRSDEEVQAEYLALLEDSVRLRFRSDAPVGINLSGGLDSCVLLALVERIGKGTVDAYTYATGHPEYDELPWVQQLLQPTQHRSIVCELKPADVPDLALSVQTYQSEPFGGLPTLAYARLFEWARRRGAVVLLDGQGMDEQWAGYDYYEAAPSSDNGHWRQRMVQGCRTKAVRPDCLAPEFRALAEPFELPAPFPDALRTQQYLDLCYFKLPSVLRFNDGISMRSSTELREPFLDYRLFELAFRQPAHRKIRNGERKWMLRQIARQFVPAGLVAAPKRPLQTPQREWLAGALREWCTDCLESAISNFSGAWIDEVAVRQAWKEYLTQSRENSFYVWQWLSMGLIPLSRSTWQE